MSKQHKIMIVIYYAIITISIILFRRLELIDNKFIDILFPFLISIPFRKGSRNMYIFYSFVFFTSIFYFRNSNENNTIDLLIITINGILSFVNIYLEIKKKM